MRRSSNKPLRATATTIHLSPTDSGVLKLDLKPESARKASHVLQMDMERHNIFFNDSGFHNHIVHLILSIYGLGASPDDIGRAYERESSYQRPACPVDDEILRRLRNKDDFKALCGRREQYPNFFAFFQEQIGKNGIASVINEYLFSGSEFADTMLVRLFGGLVHPFIHLGYGLEFNQPAIVAQALGQTAVHEANLADIFIPAEKAAGGIGKPGSKTLVQIQDEMRADNKLRNAPHWDDENKITDGLMKRAPAELIRHVSQFTVGPDQVNERVAELINAAVYFTGAAQNPAKKIKFDFFYIHAVNSAIFLLCFINQSWLSAQNKLRLLEWKGRLDLVIYASRRCVEPRLDDIKNYNATKSWEEILAHVVSHDRDDGHLAKFVRLLAYGEKICQPFEGKDGFKITDDMWLKLANMAVDSTSGPEPLWIRGAGFPEAWNDIQERARL
ncbi:hypothetical protein VTO42DRAFT_3769 [Malbranchea cinnamomea]